MAEKVAGDKKQQNKQNHQKQQQQQQQQQQKSKKAKQSGKKNNLDNGVKKVVSPKLGVDQKKKNKPSKNNISNNNSNNYNKSSKKKSGTTGSSGRRFLWKLTIHLSYILLILGFIYIVDYEKFARMRDGASFYVNKTASLLPPEVLTKGKQAAEFVQPVAEATLNKANALVNEASSFLNTNPLVKDHWTNIREISSICSARLVDYMRTVYSQTTGFFNQAKTKFVN